MCCDRLPGLPHQIAGHPTLPVPFFPVPTHVSSSSPCSAPLHARPRSPRNSTTAAASSDNHASSASSPRATLEPSRARMPPAPTRLVLLLGTAAVASATTLTTHAPGRSSNSADRHAVHALSATHNIVLREQLQQEQEQEKDHVRFYGGELGCLCRRVGCRVASDVRWPWIRDAIQYAIAYSNSPLPSFRRPSRDEETDG